jgi:Surface-adhesin protein E
MWPLLCIATVLCCAPALAADWVPVAAPDQNLHAYDRTKLFVDGDSITYWRRVVFRTPQPTKAGAARMALYRERIDCRGHTQHTLGYLLYAQDGNIIENVYTPDAPAVPVIPGTVGDRFEGLMCVFVDEDRKAREEAAKQACDPAAADALRAEVGRLEARIRDLEAQLRESVPPATAPQPQPQPQRP